MVGLRAKATALVAGAVAAEVGAFALTGNALLAAAMFAGSVGAGAAALRMWPRPRTSEEEEEPRPEAEAQPPPPAQAPAQAQAQAPAPPWTDLAARIDAIGDDATLLAQEGRARLAELTVGLGESRRELLDAFADLGDRTDGVGSALRAAQDDLAEAQSARFDAIDGALQALASAAHVEGARTIQGFDEIRQSLRAASEREREAEERLHARITEVDAGLAALAGAVVDIQVVERLHAAIERASASSASRIDDAAGSAGRRLDDIDGALRSLSDDVERVHRVVERASDDGAAREARAADLVGGRIDALDVTLRALATFVTEARQEHDAASRADAARFDIVDATLASLVSALEQGWREQGEAQRAQAAEGRAQLDAWSGRIDASVFALQRTIERSSQEIADRADAASQSQLKALTRSVDAATAATHRAVVNASRDVIARSEALAQQATGRLDHLDATLIDLAASAVRSRDEARAGLGAIEEALRGSDAAAKTRADAAQVRFDKVDAEMASISALVDERARETARAAKTAAAEANKQADARARRIERAVRAEGRRAAKSEAAGRRATHSRLDDLQDTISTAVDEAAQRIDDAADARHAAASAKAESAARARDAVAERVADEASRLVARLDAAQTSAEARARRQDAAAKERHDALREAIGAASAETIERVESSRADATRAMLASAAAHAQALEGVGRTLAARLGEVDVLSASRDEATLRAVLSTREALAREAEEHARGTAERLDAMAAASAAAHDVTIAHLTASAQDQRRASAQLRASGEAHAKALDAARRELAHAIDAARDAVLAREEAVARTADDILSFLERDRRVDALAASLAASSARTERALASLRSDVGALATSTDLRALGSEMSDQLAQARASLADSLTASSEEIRGTVAELDARVHTALRGMESAHDAGIARMEGAIDGAVEATTRTIETSIGALSDELGSRAREQARDIRRLAASHDARFGRVEKAIDAAAQANALTVETSIHTLADEIASRAQAQALDLQRLSASQDAGFSRLGGAIADASATMGSRMDDLATGQRDAARQIEERVAGIAEEQHDLQASIDGVREEIRAAVEIDAARLDAARSSLANEIGESAAAIRRDIEAASGSIAAEIQDHLARRDTRLETALGRLAAEHDPTRALIRSTQADAERTLVARFDALGALQNEAAVQARETEARLDAALRALREEQARLAEGARSLAERIAGEQRDAAKIDRDSLAGTFAAAERRILADARAGSDAQREALARLVEILVANREEEAARHERLARAVEALSDRMLAAQEHARGEAATLRAMVRDARRDERERMLTFATEIGRRFEATDAALADLARPPPPPPVVAPADDEPAVDLGEWEDPVDPDAALFAVLRPRVRRA